MSNKSQRGKKAAKKKQSTQKEAKEKKRKERQVVDTYRGAKGQKREINRKKHKGKHYKGNRKHK